MRSKEEKPDRRTSEKLVFIDSIARGSFSSKQNILKFIEWEEKKSMEILLKTCLEINFMENGNGMMILSDLHFSIP